MKLSNSFADKLLTLKRKLVSSRLFPPGNVESLKTRSNVQPERKVVCSNKMHCLHNSTFHATREILLNRIEVEVLKIPRQLLSSALL